MLRHVSSNGCKRMNAIFAETSGQTIDQSRASVSEMHWPRSIIETGEFAGFFVFGGDAGGCKADQIVAKSRIERIVEMPEAQGHQISHRFGMATGIGQPQIDPLDQAVDAIDGELKGGRPLAARFEKSTQLLGQMPARAVDCGRGEDGLDKGLLHHGRRDGLTGAYGLRVDTARLIETQDQRGAKACSERRTWTPDEIANAFQTDAAQGGNGIGRQAKRADRKLIQSAIETSTGNVGREDAQFGGTFSRLFEADTARKTPRGTHRGCNGDGGAHSVPAQAVQQIAAQTALSTQKVSAAGNIKHQSMRRIATDHRSVSIRPIGQGFEPACICRGIMRQDTERWNHGTGLCQRHADIEPLALSQEIGCHDALRPLQLGNQHKRRRIRRHRSVSSDPVGGKKWHPKTEIATREDRGRGHGELPKEEMEETGAQTIAR